MINFASNTYNGEVLEDLLLNAVEGNDTFKEGLIYIKAGIQHKYVIPSIKLGKVIQDNVPTPTSANGAADDATGMNQYTISERFLEPQDFMIYLEFNPRDYEKYWRFAQPTGNLVFRDLDPKLQATMLRLLIEKKDEYIGESIWCSAKGGTAAAKITAPADSTAIGGDNAGGPMKYFDGAIKRIIDNANSIDKNEIAGGKVVMAGNTTFADGAAVEKALYAMWKKCPQAIRKNQNLVFVTGWDVWDLYDQYLTDKQVKYTTNADINQYRFKGKRIVPICGIPEQTIVLGVFNGTMDSNLWMGVDYANDDEVVKVERLQANSELYFFQMRMKMDVNIVRPSEIVVWTAYTKTL